MNNYSGVAFSSHANIDPVASAVIFCLYNKNIDSVHSNEYLWALLAVTERCV